MNHFNSIRVMNRILSTLLIKNITRSLLVLVGAAVSSASYGASVELSLDAPHFQFSIDNNLAPEHELKLAPNEYNLSVKLKPLLDAKDYSQVLILLNANDNPEKSAALLLMTGQIYLALKQPKQAQRVLKQVLSTTPNLVRAHRSLAALYLQGKQWKEAQHHLAKAIEHGVQDPQFFGQLAYINSQQGSPWSAISGYQQALLLQPHNIAWKEGLLYALQQAGNQQSALNMVNELLNQQPKNKALWLQRAAISLALNDQPKALASMEMALRLGEKKPANLLSTAQLHLTSGSMNRAADLLIEISKDSRSSFNDIQPVITWLISDGETKQALRILKSIKNIATLPTQQQSLYYATSGSALRSTQPNTAMKQFKKSLALNPNQASVLVELAQHYQRKQQLSRAEIYYQRAQIFPDFEKQALAGLAQISLDQQRYTQALHYLERLKPLSKNWHAIEKNIEIIKRLKSQQS